MFDARLSGMADEPRSRGDLSGGPNARSQGDTAPSRPPADSRSSSA